MKQQFSPVTIAIALSLYAYNVSPHDRARKLYDHFKGACMEIGELADVLVRCGVYAATEFPYPTAKVYVQHALEKYGAEAAHRAAIEEVYLMESK